MTFGAAHEALQRGIASVVGPTVSSAAWETLSAQYRSGGATPEGADLTAELVASYAVARAPATFAAVHAVMTELRARRPGWEPSTLLDVGAGLGTAAWATVEVFPSVRRVELVERARAMIDTGRRLGAGAPASLREATWTQGDVASIGTRSADMIVASYVLSEFDPSRRSPVVASWWEAAANELVIVDAGTPVGFQAVLSARAALIAGGATLTAPCPSDGPCPLDDDDWCHFAVRVQRTAGHRRAKSATLGHEDEKYSYVAGSRSEPAHCAGRVVRHPQFRSGHVRLSVCCDGRVEPVVVGKRDRERYREARGVRWGDTFAPLT